jgi:hypothetical protein
LLLAFPIPVLSLSRPFPLLLPSCRRPHPQSPCFVNQQNRICEPGAGGGRTATCTNPPPPSVDSSSSVSADPKKRRFAKLSQSAILSNSNLSLQQPGQLTPPADPNELGATINVHYQMAGRFIGIQNQWSQLSSQGRSFNFWSILHQSIV